MKRPIVLAFFWLLFSLPCLFGDFEQTRVPVAPDGTRATVDLDGELHIRNVGGSDGAGLCVGTSVEVASRWQNVPEMDGFQSWLRRRPGGSYPPKLAHDITEFFRKKGMKEPLYIQHTGGDEELLRLVFKTRRAPCITYAGVDNFYGGVIAHMVTGAHGDGKLGAIIDNNRPGSWVWMDYKTELVNRWKGLDDNGRPLRIRGMPVGGGWLFAFLAPPPPPKVAEDLHSLLTLVDDAHFDASGRMLVGENAGCKCKCNCDCCKPKCTCGPGNKNPDCKCYPCPACKCKKCDGKTCDTGGLQFPVGQWGPAGCPSGRSGSTPVPFIQPVFPVQPAPLPAPRVDLERGSPQHYTDLYKTDGTLVRKFYENGKLVAVWTNNQWFRATGPDSWASTPFDPTKEPVSTESLPTGVEHDKVSEEPRYWIGATEVTQKQAHFMVKATSTLTDDSYKAHLTIVIQGDEKQRLELIQKIITDPRFQPYLDRVHLQVYKQGDRLANRVKKPVTLQKPASQGGDVIGTTDDVILDAILDLLKLLDGPPKKPDDPKNPDNPTPNVEPDVQPKMTCAALIALIFAALYRILNRKEN